ncbi:MAG TPA: prepilin-type N-terminal cleavage/methylation domain-containing protein, partial [Fuerstia sp.]|nr:prepilin-type N-terminal cleavage/methylation domain-containing protein [Fuerstiella sp.]
MNSCRRNRADYSFNRAPIGPRGSEVFASRAHGFTLLEVLLATGLTTLLMAALYTAMSVYWTTATESYDEIERAQIARAVLRQM